MLGEHQDSVVTRQVLHEMGIQAHLDGDSAFTFGLLYGREQQRAAALEEEFAWAWAGGSRAGTAFMGDSFVEFVWPPSRRPDLRHSNRVMNEEERRPSVG